MTSVYEPREDSELLAQVVRKLARGKVLDVGTGSGIQALAALENAAVTEVTAVDINPLAVAQVEKLQNPKLRVLLSDLFSAVKDEKFDTIICNPPYLPNHDEDSDPALDGGTNGYEWSIRFLQEAQAHLMPTGKLLFLFSNLTNRDRIDLELKKLGYLHTEEATLVHFFERLYVYRIWKP